MSTAKQISLNTLYQVVAKAITTLSTFVTTILITRNFGEDGYGEFTIVMSFVALFYLSVDFGLNAIVTRVLAKESNKTPVYFQNLLGLRFVLALLIMGLAMFIAGFLPYSWEIRVGILIATLTILSQALFVSTNAIFQTNLRYDLSAIADISSAVITLGLVYLGFVYTQNLLWIILLYTLGNFARVVVGLAFVGRFTKGVSASFDTRLWKTLLIAALPLGLAGIFSQINGYADKIILSTSILPDDLTKEKAVAYYGLAYKIFEFALVIPTFFVNAAYPVMIRHYHEGIAKLTETVQKMYLAMLGLSLLGVFVGYILAPFVIDIFRKDSSEFGLSIEILRLLVLGLPVFYLSAISMWLLVTLGKQKYLVFIYALAALVNVVLNFMFIPVYGVFAPAIITIISEIIILTISTLMAWDLIRKERSNK